MAALVKHVLPNTKLLLFQNKLSKFSTSSGLCKKPHLHKMHRRLRKNDTTLVDVEPLFPIGQSIVARGFLRSIKPYQPPENVEAVLKTIGNKIVLTTEHATRLDNPDIRYKLFRECEKMFNHRIPNSLLHTMRTLRDVYEFYTTPIDTRTPLDVLKTQDLPPNLHIQYEPLRFHPDDDTMFKGKSVFPQSSTIVTGLKSKKKFKGYQAPEELEY